MNQQLEYLVQLQEIDLRIRTLEREMALLPEEIEKFRQEFQKEQEKWESAKKRQEDSEKERRKKELDLDAAEAKLNKLNTQLLSVKTNKEYTVMLHEIQQCKDGISALEEEILYLFDQLDESSSLMKEENKKVDEKKRIFEKEKARIEGIMAKLNRDRDVLINERNEIEKGLEEGLAKEYQKLYEARKGLAVARAKDGSCIGCNILLMPQLFQEIMTDEEVIFRCPNCHRILFYKKENGEQ